MRTVIPDVIAIEVLSSLSPDNRRYTPGSSAHMVARDVLGRLPKEQSRVLLLRYAESLDAESIAAKLGQEVASEQKLLRKAFDEFLRVLRERGWIRMRGGWWYSRNCTLHPINEKRRREAQWQLVKWPGNVNEAHNVIGVALTAPYKQKRIAYLKMLRVHHPDLAFTFGPDAHYRAEDVMKKVNRAWEMICTEHEQWK